MVGYSIARQNKMYESLSGHNHESVEEFMDRVYVDFILEKALVFPHKIGEEKPQRWTLDQLRQYVLYLKSKEIII